MTRFWQELQHPKVVGWIILIIAGLCVPRTHGFLEFVGLIIVAILAFLIYALWYYRWRTR